MFLPVVVACEGGGEGRQRLTGGLAVLLTPEREDAILRAARGLNTAPMFGIPSSGPGCRDVMVSTTRVWNFFFTRFRAARSVA